MDVLKEQMFIYEIRNVLNGKRYIGATTRFSQRQREHIRNLRRNKHPNFHLQNAWNKYGEDAFQTRVICKAKTLNELDELENQYVKERGDYNIKTGGLKTFHHAESTKRKISNSRKGKPSPTKGRKFQRTIAQMDMWSQARRCGRQYPPLISPDGNLVQVVNVKRFARENNLQFSGLQSLVNGGLEYYRGWTRNGTQYRGRGYTISQRKRPLGYPRLISPNGDIYIIGESLRQFCTTHYLSVGCMSQVINRIKPSHKGWKLLEKSHG